MKKLFYLMVCAIVFTITSCNNGNNSNQELTRKDSLLFAQLDIFQKQLREETYKLYPTKNRWTYLKLNTETGQIWIVQWSLEPKERFTYTLDNNIRVERDKFIAGRFSLHSTDNMYNFILLDNISGKCWQVQWSFEENERFVVPIY